jgi:hypothetical protein
MRNGQTLGSPAVRRLKEAERKLLLTAPVTLAGLRQESYHFSELVSHKQRYTLSLLCLLGSSELNPCLGRAHRMFGNKVPGLILCRSLT